MEGAPNSRCGGSGPTAPVGAQEAGEKESFLLQMHHNLHQVVMEEMAGIDGTTQEQAWCLPVLPELMLRKEIVEEELQVLDKQKEIAEGQAMTTEFLVTKTVSAQGGVG